MSETGYGFDFLQLRAAREARGLTVAQIATAAGLSERAVSFYLAGARHPRATILPRLARAVGMVEPLDLCDLGDGERIVHLRVRVGKSRSQVAAALGWHPDTYTSWELTGRAADKMASDPAWADKSDQSGRDGWAARRFFHQDMLQRGARVDGRWRPPVYGPYGYGNPAAFAAFEVRAERLCQAYQRTVEDQEGRLRELLRDERGGQPIKPLIGL